MSSLIDGEVAELWAVHGSALWALAFGLLGDQEDAARAVTAGMTDWVALHDQGPGQREADSHRILAGLVFRRCAELLTDNGDTTASTSSPLMRRLSELAHLQRATLVLCAYGNHTIQEAARELDLSPSAVAALLNRTLGELRDWTRE